MYVVHFLPDGVFLPCDHGLDYDISLCEDSIKIIQINIQCVVLAIQETTVIQRFSHIIDRSMPIPLEVTKRYEGQRVTSK